MGSTLRVLTQVERTFNFYGADRDNIPGIHPSERMEEGVQFPFMEIELMDNETGEFLGTELADNPARLQGAVWLHAQGLLERWPDQKRIKVYERGGRDIYMSVYRDEMEAAR